MGVRIRCIETMSALRDPRFFVSMTCQDKSIGLLLVELEKGLLL